jgi:hypothetical protein
MCCMYLHLEGSTNGPPCVVVLRVVCCSCGVVSGCWCGCNCVCREPQRAQLQWTRRAMKQARVHKVSCNLLIESTDTL